MRTQGSWLHYQLDQQTAEVDLVPIVAPMQRGVLMMKNADSLLSKKQLLVDYEEANGKEQIVTFNLAGLEAAIKKLNCTNR